MIHIDKDKYSISENNRHKTQIAKTQIVLGCSLRKDSNHITRLQHKEYGKTKKWNTYTISRNGNIYEHFDPKYHSDFMNNKEINMKIISIIIENMGCLFKTPDDKYINWLHEVCDEENVVERQLSNYCFWERITDEQLISTAELCKILCDKFSIPKKLIEFNHYHKDINKFRGIVFRSNYIEDSSDINPLFDIMRFNKILDN